MKKFTGARMTLIFTLLFVSAECSFAQNRTYHSEKKKRPLRILIIGDSNTEIGNITMPMKALLDSLYGNYGTGYCTLNTNSMGRVPDSLSVKCDSNWTLFDMRNDFPPAIPPYYSPDGLSISSPVPGASVTVQFTGQGIDLYYLQQPVGGRFSISIDGVKKDSVYINSKKYGAKKKSFNSFSPGFHSMTIRVDSGTVTLLGVDVKKLNLQDDLRFVLHKWGNAWSSTKEYLNIDKNVFRTALEELKPNRVIILLGTNDHNLDHREPSIVKDNLKVIISRIEEALPSAEVWVVSTFTTDGETAKTLLPQYLAISFPEAAKETKAKYWNMNGWFGEYSPEKLPDGGVHVSETYGKLIAVELLKRIK